MKSDTTQYNSERPTSKPTILSGAMLRSAMKKSSYVICAACTDCDAMMSPIPTSIWDGVTGCVALPSPLSKLATPTNEMPTCGMAGEPCLWLPASTKEPSLVWRQTA